MHFVTLFSMVAGYHAIRAAALLPRLTPTSGGEGLVQATDQSAGYIGLALGAGILGTLFGLIDTGAAVQMVEGDAVIKAIMRGIGISVNTFAFALMLALPLSLVGLVTRARAARRLTQ